MPYKIETPFSQSVVPPSPDYSQKDSWAAWFHMPKGTHLSDKSKNKIIDSMALTTAVFFVYPTIYTYQPTNAFVWNADVNDSLLNERIKNSTIRNQLSIFSPFYVFAPRYRQAHYSAYTTQNKEDAAAALNLAYQDVKTAFKFFITNVNKDSPFILAGHSQGTTHLIRLIKEEIDGTELAKKLVVAYLVGMPVQADEFRNIKPLRSSQETGGFVSWNTYSEGYEPPDFNTRFRNAVCTNPINWRTDNTPADYKDNLGGIGAKLNYIPNLSNAVCHGGILWIGKPRVFGAGLIKSKNWHRADYNLFWLNIRANAIKRMENYLNNPK